MNMYTPTPELLGAQAREVEAEAARRRRTLRLKIAAGVLAVLAVVGFVLWRASEAPPPAAPAELPRVSVIQPALQPVATTVRVTGAIAARRDQPVGIQGQGGQVVAIRAEAGQYVRAGQVLAEIDKSVVVQQVAQLGAAVEQARANARLAQAELDRALTLVDRGFISRADIDRRTATRDAANASVKLAAAQLAEARARLGQLDVRAPTAGLVLQRSVEVGQVVSPGSGPLFRIAEGGRMEMRARVAEQDMAALRVGQTVTVTPTGSARGFAGTIWLLEPVIDPTSRQGAARIALPADPALRVGAFASAAIAAGEAQRPVLPQSAVLSDDQGSYVFAVGEGNRVERRPVTIADVSERGIAVEGLRAGDRVVQSAGAFLTPGEKIDPVLAR